MGETFYSVLGVESGADTESIRRAYRRRVKEHHPDVSDAPDAPERFKRLTTARDVLVDETERERYDRLGHERYVRRHVASSVWTAGQGGSGDSTTPGEATGADERGGDRTSGGPGPEGTADATGSTGRTTWLGENATRRGGRASDTGPGRRRRRAGRHVAGTADGGQGWQHATRAYRRADTDVGDGPESLLRSVARGAREVGPWLGVHFVFILSAFATAWFAFFRANDFGLSLPALTFGVVVFGLVIFLSVIHVVAQLYT